MNKNEMKPCPFCGNAYNSIRHIAGGDHIAVCTNCKIEISIFPCVSESEYIAGKDTEYVRKILTRPDPWNYSPVPTDRPVVRWHNECGEVQVVFRNENNGVPMWKEINSFPIYCPESFYLPETWRECTEKPKGAE